MTILALCDRFHVTPERALEMDASVIRMLKIEAIENRRLAREKEEV